MEIAFGSGSAPRAAGARATAASSSTGTNRATRSVMGHPSVPRWFPQSPVWGYLPKSVGGRHLLGRARLQLVVQGGPEVLVRARDQEQDQSHDCDHEYDAGGDPVEIEHRPRTGQAGRGNDVDQHQPEVAGS